MNKIISKWNSRRGASFAMGLVFFLLCAMVGVTVLTAASVNAGQIKTLRQGNQDYLTVASAARLLREEINGMRFTAEETSVYNRGDGGGTEISYDYAISSGKLADLLKADATTVYRNGQQAARSLTLDMGELDTVSINYVMDLDYGLTLTLSLADSDASRQQYTLTLSAEEDSLSHVSREHISYLDYIDTETGQPVYDSYTVVTTIVTTDVIWGNPLIEEVDS